MGGIASIPIVSPKECPGDRDQDENDDPRKYPARSRRLTIVLVSVGGVAHSAIKTDEIRIGSGFIVANDQAEAVRDRPEQASKSMAINVRAGARTRQSHFVRDRSV